MTASSQNSPPDEGDLVEAAEAVQASGMTRSYDGLTVDAIAQGAAAQARVESRAELTRARQEHESLTWLRDRWTAAATLAEGCHPVDGVLRARDVLAALDGSAPSTLPLTMSWDGWLDEPDGDGPGAATFIRCITSRGGRAALALTPEERLVLGAQLLATLHMAEACTREGCGRTADEDATPTLLGWIRVQVAGIDGPPRWWCSPMCAISAMAAAGTELAETDQAAAVDPDAQAYERLHGGDEDRDRDDDWDRPDADEVSQDPDDGKPWPPNGGHDDLCAYAGGISRDCTCTTEGPEYLDGQALRLAQGLPAEGGAR